MGLIRVEREREREREREGSVEFERVWTDCRRIRGKGNQWRITMGRARDRGCWLAAFAGTGRRDVEGGQLSAQHFLRMPPHARRSLPRDVFDAIDNPGLRSTHTHTHVCVYVCVCMVVCIGVTRQWKNGRTRCTAICDRASGFLPEIEIRATTITNVIRCTCSLERD